MISYVCAYHNLFNIYSVSKIVLKFQINMTKYKIIAHKCYMVYTEQK